MSVSLYSIFSLISMETSKAAGGGGGRRRRAATGGPEAKARDGPEGD